MIDDFKKSFLNIDVKFIDFTDNMCWEGNCELLTPDGYPIMKDNNHFANYFSQYWLNSVDLLT